jgi:CheY-like chemotaxis protein
MVQETVLIVEDDATIRNTLQAVLQSQWYHTIVARDGQEALEIIPKLPEPTVILLDYMMPRVNGYGVLRDLADHPEKRDDHPIFLLTANVSQMTPDMVRLLGEQRIPVLLKPFDLEAVIREVSTAFARIRGPQP